MRLILIFIFTVGLFLISCKSGDDNGGSDDGNASTSQNTAGDFTPPSEVVINTEDGFTHNDSSAGVDLEVPAFALSDDAYLVLNTLSNYFDSSDVVNTSYLASTPFEVFFINETNDALVEVSSPIPATLSVDLAPIINDGNQFAELDDSHFVILYEERDFDGDILSTGSIAPTSVSYNEVELTATLQYEIANAGGRYAGVYLKDANLVPTVYSDSSGPDVLPSAVSFADTDFDADEVGGDIIVSKAGSEAAISHYVLYWGETAIIKSSDTPITELAITGSDITYTLPSDSTVPANTAFILVYTRNSAGESSNPRSTPLVDKKMIVFSYTGADQNWMVPADVTSISVKAWGAGGGGNDELTGAAGGYAADTDVVVTGGDTLTVVVGQGGVYRGQTSTYGGGGRGGNGDWDFERGSSGGGRSGVYDGGSNPLVVAGGGGGAPRKGFAPGAGGGLSGLTGSADVQSGVGGTTVDETTCTDGEGGDSTQAALDGSPGLLNTGGAGSGLDEKDDYGGGGGGGGHCGGGGGTGGEDGTPKSGGGGGGGSSFIVAGTDSETLAGSGVTPGNDTDSDRAGAGAGGALANDGAHGIVVIFY